MKLLSVDPSNYADAPTEGIRRILSMYLGNEIPRAQKIPTEREQQIIGELTSETVVVPPMEYKMAAEYKNRDGELYISLTTDKLTNMRRELNGKLFKREYKEESVAIAESKLAAINAILEARAKAPK
jgi:hypothetical protein